jgi:DNA repair exonuclease SbcCD nuclease subunit
VFISPGNHDFFSSRSVYATLDWPENVHIFHTDGFQQAAFPELGCVVHGRAFLDRHWAEDPLAGFHAPKDGLLHLMVLHGEVDGVGQYGPISPASIAESGLTYLALGHIHQYSGLSQTGDTYWAYPGCPEGRGFDELGDKGVLFLQISPENVSAQFLPLARRRYQQLSVDLTGANSPLSALLAALPEDTGEDVYRLILTGSCETPDVAGLHRALEPRFYGLQIQDRTHLPQNLWQRREEDTLTGLFLQTMWAKCQAEPDSPVYELAARFGLAALEQGEDVSP